MTEQVTNKRMGRPPKSSPVISKELSDLKKAYAELELAYGEACNMASKEFQKSANLEHQVIGYKAVISYLEAQLGLKSTQ